MFGKEKICVWSATFTTCDIIYYACVFILRTDCSIYIVEAHQANRRSEFIILEM